MASDPVAADALPKPAADAAGLWRYRMPIGIASIMLLSFLVYFPALKGGFLWDDDALVTDNPLIRAPDGLYRIWFTKEPVDYWPVSNSTLWLEWRLWGMDTTGYHITNVLLHILTSLLVWAVLRELRIPGAFLGALLFAVHPVNVESVAWIAQRKTVMATMFGLLCILAYVTALRADDRQAGRATWGWYALSWLAFVLGMLSKGSIATLPVGLLACAWWLRGRITLRDVVWTVPFLLVALPLVLVNMWFQTHGIETIVREVTPLERVLGAGAVPWFYLYKALVPLNLIFIYPQWKIQATNPLWWLPLLACLGVTLALWWFRDRWWCRGLLFAWLFFCVMLVPVMGFTDVIFMVWSLVADHYQYLAIAAVVAVVAAALTIWKERGQGRTKSLAIVTQVLLVVTLFLLSREQSKMYLSAERHWQTTIDLNPTCHVAYNNLASMLIKQHRLPESLPLVEEALRLLPDNAEAEVNMGLILMDQGRLQEASGHFEQALRIRPYYALASCNLGGLLISMGKPQQAIPYLEQALQIKPEYPDAESNLGLALLRLDRPQEAVEHFRRALQFSSKDDARARKNLGNVLFDLGRYDEALDQFAEAARLDPQDVEAQLRAGAALVRLNRQQEAKAQFDKALAIQSSSAKVRGELAAVLMELGQTADALAQLQQAIQAEPNSAEAQNNLGGALLSLDQPQAALPYFDRAIQLKPDFAEAYNNRGAVLFRIDQTPEAIRCYEQALQLKPDFARAHNNLANALLKAGQTAQAFEHYEQALKYQPDLVEVHNDLGRALGNADRPREAVEHFEQALRLKPKDVEIENNLAAALASSERPREAITHLDRVIEQNPDFVLAWVNLAMVRAQLREITQAITAADKARQLARAQNQTVLAEQLETMLQTLRAEPAAAPSSVTPVPGPALPP